MAEYDQLPRAVRIILNDPRNVDTNFTVFDTISCHMGVSVEKMVIQMGDQTVHR